MGKSRPGECRIAMRRGPETGESRQRARRPGGFVRSRSAITVGGDESTAAGGSDADIFRSLLATDSPPGEQKRAVLGSDIAFLVRGVSAVDADHILL